MRHSTKCFILVRFIKYAKLNDMKDPLATLSLNFAAQIIRLCDTIPNRGHIKNQILRSGSSIGANIHEARYGYSKDEFIFKLQIALKECNETAYWIQLLQASETITKKQSEELLNQCKRIRIMLIKSLNTAKGNVKK